MRPDFSYENKVWERNFSFVAGLDEVGRGAFAGAVVSGCVIFEKGIQIPDNIIIDDSKKLTSKQRETASKWVKQNCLAWGIGEASVSFINKYGIVKATNKAFRSSVQNAQKQGRIKIDHLLIDAFYIPFVKGLERKRQNAIIKGDSHSISIASLNNS